MLEILKCEEINNVKQSFSEAGFEYNGNSGMLVAKDKNDILGYSLYRLTSNEMTILKIEPVCDIMLFDGILRSTLHIAAERSIMDVFYCDAFDSEQILEKLGFIKDKEQRLLNIDLLFGGCCCQDK